MKKNMGWTDRIIRLLVAVVLVILYFTGVITGVWGIILLVVAAIFLLTGLLAVCPLYFPFGCSTICKPKQEQ